MLAYNIPDNYFDKEKLSKIELAELKHLLEYYKKRNSLLNVIREHAVRLKKAKENGFPYSYALEDFVLEKVDAW